MNTASPLGFGGGFSFGPAGPRTEHILIRRPLQKLLEFRRRTIDDIVNSRIVKNEIAAYWKMHRQIDRIVEVGDLERQWNAIRL